MQIPFHKPFIGEEELAAVAETLRSGWLTTGPRAKQFEGEFAAYVQAKHGVAVNSATAALHLALEAVGVSRGDAVLVPTMTFAATAEVVRYFDAEPILVDCCPDDSCIDITDARRRLESAAKCGVTVKAIIPVHYAGQIADMLGVRKLADEYKLRVIEDAAHCCPAYYRDSEDASWKPTGAESDICCYSFYANKCITTGEGGMACTNEEALADRMRIMALHGISKDAWKRFTAQGSWYYEIIAPGYKYNLTDIAASIGVQQLRRADWLRSQREEVAAKYTQLLERIPEIVTPRAKPNRIHSWHLYAIRVKVDMLQIDRAQVIDRLKQAGVGASVHWIPLHMHPYYRDKYAYTPADFPVAAAIARENISLPIYPGMTDSEVQYVANALKNIIEDNRKC